MCIKGLGKYTQRCVSPEFTEHNLIWEEIQREPQCPTRKLCRNFRIWDFRAFTQMMRKNQWQHMKNITAFSESLWKWATSVKGALNTMSKRILESLVRCEEVLGAERSQLLLSKFLGEAIPLVGKSVKSPGLGSCWLPGTHINSFCWGQGTHTHVCLQMYLLWGNSCSCQTVTNFGWTYSIEKPILMNLQLYQHHKKPEFHYFSQSNWLRVTLNFKLTF